MRSVAVDFSLTALSHGSVLAAAPDPEAAPDRMSLLARLQSTTVLVSMVLAAALAVAFAVSAMINYGRERGYYAAAGDSAFAALGNLTVPTVVSTKTT